MTTLAPIESLLAGVYGNLKTAKTSMMLTLPKPLFVFDLDQSFDRALGRLLTQNPGIKVLRLKATDPLDETLIIQYDVIVREYDMPIQLPGTQLNGFIELWEQIIPEFVIICDIPLIQSIGIDTGTLFWTAAHSAMLQRVQERPSERLRTSLLPIEYARPNTETKALYGRARTKGKHLVVLHHLGQKRGKGFEQDKKGNKVLNNDMYLGETWSGFTHLGAVVDVICKTNLEVHCTRCDEIIENTFASVQVKHALHEMEKFPNGNVKLIPTMTIEESGYTLAASGFKMVEPSYLTLINYINAIRNSGA